MDARKVRYGRKDLKTLLAGARRVVAARGKQSVVFDMQASPPSLDELAAAVLGPTGNLRAPALKLGGTWLIGFGEPAYEDLLG